jgi:hypothetical protein
MTAPVERKVKAATGGASVATAVSTLAIFLLYKYVFPANMDPLAETEIVAVVPTIVGAAGAFAAGYFARHTPRSDAPPAVPPVPTLPG